MMVLKNAKWLIIGNIILLLIIVYTYFLLYKPELIRFNQSTNQPKGGDYLTNDLLPLLFHYGCIFLFYIVNIVYLILGLKKRMLKNILIPVFFIIVLTSFLAWEFQNVVSSIPQEEEILINK